MNKLNRTLLICNIVLLVVVVAAVFSACNSNAKVQWLEQQVNSLVVALQNVQNDLYQEQVKNANLKSEFDNFKSYAENNFALITYQINILLNK